MDKYDEWLNSEYINENDKEILKNMSKDEIEDAFFTDLTFGTAGIRGIMGLGSNRINKYTIGKVTVGLSNYLNKNFNDPSVVIAYDTRNNSKDYAYDTAFILNYYGIKTYIFTDFTSTPELSFAVKYLNCTSGIVITSSHNSKEYNGYKVYNSLGGQIVPPEDDLIIKEINDITDFKSIKKAPLNNELFNIVNDDVHEAFLNENINAIINRDLFNSYSNEIKITYSSLHGVGLKTTKELFKKLNLNDYCIVDEQCTYDGNFPTCPNPNPEIKENFNLSIKIAKENNSDIILITDPDADRLGVMYKDSNNEYTLINGDLLGALFSYYIVNNSKINDNSYMIRSIVTSPLIDKIGKRKNIKTYEVLTGCKNIANKRNKLNNENYLFGYEESLGYMFNINVNDKNGFSSMLVMIEILCYCKKQNISLNDYLEEIYKENGYLLNHTICFTCNDINFKEKIDNLMNKFRNKELTFNENYKIEDYLNRVGENNTNALKYIFDDESWIIIRPSGTEPKIKVYIGVCTNNKILSQNRLNYLINNINSLINLN